MPKTIQAVLLLIFCFAAVIVIAFLNSQVMPYLSPSFAVGWFLGAGTCLFGAFLAAVLCWDQIYNAWVRR